MQRNKRTLEKKEFSPHVLRLIKEYKQQEINLLNLWGSEARVLSLVSNELRLKFKKARDLYADAYNSKDDAKMLEMINMMKRAFDVLIKDLRDQGYREVEADIRCFDWDGDIWYVTDMDYQLPRARATTGDPNANYISIQELLRAVPKEMMDMRLLLAKQFEGSSFQYVKTIKGKNG